MAVQRVQWFHGGKGACQFCGAESKHRAWFTTSDGGGKLLLCRDCAQRVRADADGFLGKAMKASTTSDPRTEQGRPG